MTQETEVKFIYPIDGKQIMTELGIKSRATFSTWYAKAGVQGGTFDYNDYVKIYEVLKAKKRGFKQPFRGLEYFYPDCVESEPSPQAGDYASASRDQQIESGGNAAITVARSVLATARPAGKMVATAWLQEFNAGFLDGVEEIVGSTDSPGIARFLGSFSLIEQAKQLPESREMLMLTAATHSGIVA